jgi:hypothetical protein
MSVDPRRLIAAHRAVEDALERDRRLADEEQAIHALVETGVQLAAVLGEVVADREFWDRAADSAARLTGSEQFFLTSLAGGDLVGIFVLLGYEPPPPVDEFVDEAVEVIGSALALSIGPEQRRLQVQEAEIALGRFNERLRDLLEGRGLISPVVRRRRLRSFLRRGGRVALAVAPPLAAWLIGAGAPTVGVPSEPLQSVAEVAGVWVAGHLPHLLREHVEDAQESIDILSQVDPRTRVRGLSKVVEGRFRRLEMSSELSREDVSSLWDSICRAITTAFTYLEQSEATKAGVRAFLEAFETWRVERSEFELAGLRSGWVDLAQVFDAAPTREERALQIKLEQEAAAAEEARRHAEQVALEEEEERRQQLERQRVQREQAARAQQQQKQRYLGSS